MVVILLPDLLTAKRASEDLRAAVYAGRIRAADWVIAERAGGKVQLHHMKDSGALRGFGEGAVLGGIAGLMVGSVLAPALVVGAVGAAAASLHQGGLPKQAMNEIGEAVAEGHTALLILTDPSSARIVADETFANSSAQTFTIDPRDTVGVREAASQITHSFEEPRFDPLGGWQPAE
jgi:uncharacterized membrane protein